MAPSHKRVFSKMTVQKACEHDLTLLHAAPGPQPKSEKRSLFAAPGPQPGLCSVTGYHW